MQIIINKYEIEKLFIHSTFFPAVAMFNGLMQMSGIMTDHIRHIPEIACV